MKKLYLSILFLLAGVGSVFSQDVEQAVRERLQAFFQTYIPVNVNIGTCRLDSVLIDFHRKTIRIYADNTFSYQPFRPETVNRIYRNIKEILPGPVTYFDIPSTNLFPTHTETEKKTRAACLPIYTIKMLPG